MTFPAAVHGSVWVCRATDPSVQSIGWDRREASIKGGIMAIIIDSVSIKGLRKTHFSQLLAYMECWDILGGYYGNKEQFEKRHEELRKWLKDTLYSLEEGAVIQK